MRIFLIGFMKSGKSTIANYIGKTYNIETYFLDQIFESKYGDINEFFEKYGEKSFREKESEILVNTSFSSNSIISCGGGIILEEKNMIHAKELGKIVYLYNKFDVLLKRESQNTRPNWQDYEQVKKLYYKRESIYRKYADYVIENEDIENTAKRIVNYGKYNF